MTTPHSHIADRIRAMREMPAPTGFHIAPPDGRFVLLPARLSLKLTVQAEAPDSATKAE